MRSVPTDEIRAFWKSFLERTENVKRMTDVSDRGRPAVEPLQDGLLAEFGPDVTKPAFDKHKREIGRMARKVMEENGYTHLRKDVKVKGRVFNKASTYEKKIT